MATKAIYHHLTPQTYMRAWKHGKSRVYVVDKDMNGLGKSIKTKDFGGIDNYHSLRAGSLMRNEDDCNFFFKPLANYTIIIDDNVVGSSLHMNDRFYEFDTWTIINTNGNIVTELEKKTLKDSILAIHIKDIEVGWGKQYENDWNSIIGPISEAVFSNPTAKMIPAIKRDELIKFMVSIEWRTKPYHSVLQESLDQILTENGFFNVDFKSMSIPESERLYPFLETLYDEFAHSLILSYFRQFLDGKGHIWNNAINFINKTFIVLYLAPIGGEFITRPLRLM